MVRSGKHIILAATSGPLGGDRDVVQKLPDTNIKPR
jgi:methylglyoxal synthase